MTESTSDIEGYPCEACHEFVPSGEDHGELGEWLCADCYGLSLVAETQKALSEGKNHD